MPSGIYTRTKEMYIGRGAKISASLIGHKCKPVTVETRKKISLALTGIKRSKSTKLKMSLCKAGVKRPTLTIEHRLKLSKALRGSKSHLWKGGITKVNIKIRHSFEYRKWRNKVFSRDNYTCVECGVKSGEGKKVILNADHIKPFAFFPELRFSIDNGRTLCLPCHKKTETYKRKVLINKI